ncbi:MAG: hypothetical protein V2A65_02880 [Candidatus Omnitrophota bacterium]
MDFEDEEKEKVSKGLSPDMEKVKVGILVGPYRIEGVIHLHREGRLSDFINAPTRLFIPVVDAKFYEIPTNRLVEERAFVNINRTSIVLFYPL